MFPKIRSTLRCNPGARSISPRLVSGKIQKPFCKLAPGNGTRGTEPDEPGIRSGVSRQIFTLKHGARNAVLFARSGAEQIEGVASGLVGTDAGHVEKRGHGCSGRD